MGYYNAGDDAKRLLEFLPWAQNFARGCASRLPGPAHREDLQSAGVLGYLLAAERYDSAKGASFLGYCSVRIRGAVVDELRRWEWAPRSVHKNRKRITEVTLKLLEDLGRDPTESETASALGLTEAELETTRRLACPRSFASFDEISTNSQGEENLSLADRLADTTVRSPDAALIDAEDRRVVRQSLHRLPKTQAIIIVLNYLQNVPLREVAAILAVTPSRVSQLHHQALARLRQSWQQSQDNR